MRLGDAREVGYSWEVLADQAVGVFVAAALSGTSRLAAVDLHLGGDRKALVRMHLLALVPRQRTSQLLGQFADVLGKRRNDRRRVLARKLDQHRKAAVALNQCGDVRIIPSAKKVAYPMDGHGTILGLGGPLADRDHIED